MDLLAAYIEMKNEDNDYCKLAGAEYWHEDGVHTPLEFAKALLFGGISDLHKEVYGSRPRGFYDFDAMSFQELQMLHDELCDSAEREYLEQQKLEQECVERFEALLANLISIGAKTRTKAIDWLLDGDAHDGYEAESLEWQHGLPWGYLKNNYNQKAA